MRFRSHLPATTTFFRCHSSKDFARCLQVAASVAALCLHGGCSHKHDELPPLPGPAQQPGLTLQSVAGQEGAVLANYSEQGQLLYLWVLPRPQEEGYSGDEQGFCVRVEDAAGRVIDSAGPASCPQALDEDRDPHAAKLTYAELVARNALIGRAQRALTRAGSAGGSPALAHLQRQVESLEGEMLRAQQAAAGEAGEGRQKAAAAATSAPLGAAQPDRSGAAFGAAAPKDQLLQLPVLGPVGKWFARLRLPAQRHENPALEFTQDIHLYSKKVKKYLIFGEEGEMDHTATILVVKARPIDSQTPWQIYSRTVTRNHGTFATDPSMTRYDVCTDLPVTRGWYAWKGECPGDWGDDHLCNDDTRLQIWHAYGQWSEQAYCKDMFQGYRPSCRKPW